MNKVFNTVNYSLFQAFWRVSRTSKTAPPAVSTTTDSNSLMRVGQQMEQKKAAEAFLRPAAFD
jgi:hypothetical protein